MNGSITINVFYYHPQTQATCLRLRPTHTQKKLFLFYPKLLLHRYKEKYIY